MASGARWPLLLLAPIWAASVTGQRLRITNGCEDEPLWVAHSSAKPRRSDSQQNVQLLPHQSYDFSTFDGLTGARYWPKMRCDGTGQACGIGQSDKEGEVASPASWAPSFDTKFEGSFGINGMDWVDINLVDGYTLPFRFEMRGNCSIRSGGPQVLDCSRLSLDACPRQEPIEGSEDVSLHAVHPSTGDVVGCYSPCSKLTLPRWSTKTMGQWDPAARPYCCPEQPENPWECRAKTSEFVKVVHERCPGVNGYSFDEEAGLMQCPSDTRYELTFYCPATLAKEATTTHAVDQSQHVEPAWPARPQPTVPTQPRCGGGALRVRGEIGSSFAAGSRFGAGFTVTDGGDRLELEHGSGASVVTSCLDEEDWTPESFKQFHLLGKTISFDLDLSHVGCACNLAFYLVSAPAHSRSGQPARGDGSYAPYYCDANKVGGQWCPEIDIMEANNHVFQATPHKCDSAANGDYTQCDRSGCAQNTRDMQEEVYGPGTEYTINTLEPFTVSTTFPAKAGTLIGMKTTLTQRGRQVVLDSADCKADYLAKLSDAMAQGMSLRITYWGKEAYTMAWLDSPPCGWTASCEGDNAGPGVIGNITVSVAQEERTRPVGRGKVEHGGTFNLESHLVFMQKSDAREEVISLNSSQGRFSRAMSTTVVLAVAISGLCLAAWALARKRPSGHHDCGGPQTRGYAAGRYEDGWHYLVSAGP